MSDVFETLVGRICLEKGWVTQDQLIQCLKECGSSIDGHGGLRLSDIIVGKGYVKSAQLEEVRKEYDQVFAHTSEYQIIRKDDVLLGQMLIKRKQVSADAVKSALAEQELEAKRGGQVPRLGEILVKMGATSFAAIEEILVRQREKVTLFCPTCRASYSVAPYDRGKKYLCKKCGAELVHPDDASSPAKTITHLDQQQPPEVAKASSNPKNVLGKYVVVKELGRGGMGAVYKAWDGGLKRWVALKLLTGAGEGEELARFQREAQTAASLRHPSIVGIYEVGQHEDKHFIAMEYIDGHTLVGERMPVRKAVEIVAEVTRAVDYAHSKGIIHRDIKPHNIMVDGSGKPFVMDFGLAKSLKGESQITQSGMVVGTPSYMSPEQAEGKLRAIDKRSDIYSIGAVLYELLTGRPPFKGGTPVETLRRVVNDDPVPPSDIVKTVPRDVETITLKCLEKEKARRYPSARLLADDLERWLQGEAIAARPVSMITRVSKKITKNKSVAVASVVVAAAVLIAAAILFKSMSAHQDDFNRQFAAADGFFKKKDYKAALIAYKNLRGLEDTPEVRRKIQECDERIKEIEEQESAEKERLKKEHDEEIRKEQEKAAQLKREEERKAEARRKAQPEYDEGQRELDKAQKMLYIPNISLVGMKSGLESAVGHFSNALDACPEFHEAYYGRGQAQALLFHPDEAERDFTKAIGLLPTYVASYIARGRLCLTRYLELVTSAESTQAERDRPEIKVWRDKALADFKKAEDLGTLGKAADFVRASLLFAEAKFEEVVRILSKLIDSGERSEEYYKLRGNAYGEIARSEKNVEYFQKAFDDYTQALALCANYYEARRYRAEVLLWQGKNEEAYKDFKAGLEINPNDSFALSDLGTYYQRTGRDDLAMEYHTKAINLNPRNFRALTNRGVVKLYEKNYRGAIEDFDNALKVNPVHLAARFNRACALFYLHSETESLNEFEQVLKDNPDFALGYFTRGQIQVFRQHWKEALDDLNRCVKLDARMTEKAQPLIAQCRRKLGE